MLINGIIDAMANEINDKIEGIYIHEYEKKDIKEEDRQKLIEDLEEVCRILDKWGEKYPSGMIYD